MISFSEFGMSEWLIGCAFVLFIIVLVDGFRRMRAERRQEIKWDLQLSRDLPDDSEAEQYNDELLDNYRVVNRAAGGFEAEKGADDAEYIPAESSDNRDLDWTPQQGHATHQSHSQEELFSSSDSVGSSDYPPQQNNQHSTASSVEDGVEEQVGDQSTFASNDMQLIVLHVKARNAQGFSGSDIVQVLVACNMRYGENQILHRYVDTKLNAGPVEFSCANMVEPGTFDLDNLGEFKTPGVTFFMALPGSAPDPLKSFNTMIETADCVVKTLNGVLLDEEHSTANLQVINHYRDRVKALSANFTDA